MPYGTRARRRSTASLFSPTALPGFVDRMGGDSAFLTDGGCDFDGTNDLLFHADDAAFDLQATDFTVACWACFDTVAGALDAIMSKFRTTTAQRSWILHRNLTTLQAYISYDLTNSDTILSPAVVVGTATWYFCVLRLNNTARTAQLSISNAGAMVHGTATALTAGAPANSTAQFMIGANNDTGPSYLDGKVSNAGIWTRLFTDGELTTLYNAGKGKSYAQLSVDELVGLTDFWNLSESVASAARGNKASARHLTATGDPIAFFNPVNDPYAASDEEGLKAITSYAGSLNPTQATDATKQPTLETSTAPYKFIAFDGSNDEMTLTTAMALAGGFWIGWVGNEVAVPSTLLGNAAGSTIFVKRLSTTQTVISDGTNTRTFTHAALGAGMHVHVINGDASALRHWVDGVESAGAGTSFAAVTFDVLGRDGTGTAYFNGTLGDFIYGSGSVLTDAQVNSLGAWLA